MKFKYVKVGTKDPVFPHGGVMHRFRPIIEIGISGLNNTLFQQATLDSGADDTIFPISWAEPLGIDLTNAPLGKATAANGTSFQYYYAEVELQLTSVGGEEDEKIAWRAIV